MPPLDRSFAEVLQDIVQNLQGIIRSEVRLAKTEVREGIKKTRAAIVLLVLAGFFGFFAALFLLLCTLYGLSYVMPLWSAALTISAVLSLAAVAAGISFRQQLKQVKQIAPKTVEPLKETIEWTKQ